MDVSTYSISLLPSLMSTSKRNVFLTSQQKKMSCERDERAEKNLINSHNLYFIFSVKLFLLDLFLIERENSVAKKNLVRQWECLDREIYRTSVFMSFYLIAFFALFIFSQYQVACEEGKSKKQRKISHLFRYFRLNSQRIFKCAPKWTLNVDFLKIVYKFSS